MQKETIEFIIKVTGISDSAVKGFTKLIGPATALTAAAGAAGYAFKKMADDFTGSIDAMVTLSGQTGASIEMINGLKFAAESTGKTMEELIPRDIAKRILETSQGTGEAKKGFDALGLSADIMSGELSSTDDVLRATIKALF